MRLAQDIHSGKQPAETLIHVDSSGVLCLKWPEAFNACGLESKSILDELSRRNWLALDPMSPFRKVTEIEVARGQKWKVVRLQPAIRQIMAIGISQAERPIGPTPPAEPVEPVQLSLATVSYTHLWAR